MNENPPPNTQNPTIKINRIQKLSDAVANRIAAGEVIQRPGNALKELLENSLDAGATNIQVQALEGGLKFLQIQDNGSGIQLEDLPLVCERFATSKLRKFDDLEAISTFGFRGEALASISHVARVSITTRTKDSKCAYKAQYSGGELIPAKQGGPPNPQPCAGNQGTQISVEDMFYNAPLRRKAFKLPNEEYQRILDVVNRYAVHCSGVSFSCKKQGSNFPDVNTSSQSSTVDKISQIYGRSLALELLEFKANSEEFKFQCKGYITHSNYNARRLTFLLFINNRSVTSNSLKKAIESVYAPLLLKGSHPFIYLDLQLPSNLVDVNVHPTKREVHFLYEAEVIAAIAHAIQAHLENSNSSRTFQAQALFSSGKGSAVLQPTRSKSTLAPASQEAIDSTPPRREASFPSSSRLTEVIPSNQRSISTFPSSLRLAEATPPSQRNTNDSFLNDRSVTQTPSSTKKQVNRYVRTDSQLQTLDSFYSSIKSPNTSRLSSTLPETPKRPLSLLEREATLLDTSITEVSAVKNSVSSTPRSARRKKVEVRLNSVLELIKEFKSQSGDEIKNLFTKSTFVGCIDVKRAAIQFETKLYMVNYELISRILFYQMTLLDFCNFSTIEISPPAPIARLVNLALSSISQLPPLSAEFSSQHDPALSLVNFLVSRREMLEEYFLITIDVDGNLTKLPALIPRYSPPAHKLPLFLARLGSQVNWNEEKACFATLSQELALLYQTDFNCSAPSQNNEPNAGTKAFYHTIQHSLYPAIKKNLSPPRVWLNSHQNTAPTLDDAICLLADLPDLYKVFERC